VASGGAVAVGNAARASISSAAIAIVQADAALAGHGSRSVEPDQPDLRL